MEKDNTELLEKSSLGYVRDRIEWLVMNAERNHANIYSIPFIIKEDFHKYPALQFYFGRGKNGYEGGVEYYKSDEIIPVVPDIRPEGGGEYWDSRGPSDFDVSGFVKSKEAGQRLLRYVKYVLEKDETSTWLDYREREPNWIQFKFSAKEFDVNKLHNMTIANNNIITEEIIKSCKL